MAKTRKLTRQQMTEIKAMRDSGKSFKEIGRIFEVAPMTALRAFALAGGSLPESPSYQKIVANSAKRNGPKPVARRKLMAGGYMRVLIHDDDPFFCMATKCGASYSILEHRLVLARKLGRPLKDHETVHHINADRADNRPENLELRVGRHGNGATGAHCATCRCFEH